jgi:Recombinase
LPGRTECQHPYVDAKELRPIFAELTGKPDREIARILNERKINTPSGAPWSAVTVSCGNSTNA